ncbi:MAG: TetR/AcrR family transcriptional regulator [Candidatus Izemoplasma sp.]
MNQRQLSKAFTRQLILDKTALLLEQQGFFFVSTKQIADKCGISQGTIFLHFQTKDNLLNSIILNKVVLIEADLKQLCHPDDSKEVFFKNYMDVMIKHEDILSRLYKDLPYLSEQLSKNITGLEATIKKMFFDNIRNHNKLNLSIVDLFIHIDAILSQIYKNLIEKETYSEHNSILKQRRGKTIKLHRALFG